MIGLACRLENRTERRKRRFQRVDANECREVVANPQRVAKGKNKPAVKKSFSRSMVLEGRWTARSVGKEFRGWGEAGLPAARAFRNKTGPIKRIQTIAKRFDDTQRCCPQRSQHEFSSASTVLYRRTPKREGSLVCYYDVLLSLLFLVWLAFCPTLASARMCVRAYLQKRHSFVDPSERPSSAWKSRATQFPF